MSLKGKSCRDVILPNRYLRGWASGRGALARVDAELYCVPIVPLIGIRPGSVYAFA